MAFYPYGDPTFVPSYDITSIGYGLSALSGATSGVHNMALGYQAGSKITTGGSNLCIGYQVASTTLTTGSNNIIIGTSSAADAGSASTSNSFWLGGGATAIMSATAINGTPVVTIPGSLIVSGGGVGLTVGAIATGTYSQANSAVLNAVTGLSVTLTAGATYLIDIYLATTNGATGGIALKFGGTATATSLLADTWVYNTTTVTAEVNIASLASNLVGAAVAATSVTVSGTIVVNAGGTLTLTAGQQVSNGTALTIANNSFMQLTRIA